MRTALLVGVLAAGYLLVLSTAAGRAFFQLEPLPVEIVAILGVLAGTWTWAVVHIHRTRVVQGGIDILIAAWRNRRPTGVPA
jgi:hypothetical protein